jgi:thiosulfate/3-mercaptopyruvate sulfurtransferase
MTSFLTLLLLGAQVPAESLLVSAQWLMTHRNDPGLVLLLVDHQMDGRGPREVIPGSVALDYMAITTNVGGVGTELIPLDSLRVLLEGIGVSNTSRVVVYSPDPIMAARGFMTLEAAGHDRVQLLDGGPGAWKAAGGSIVNAPSTPRARGRFVPRPRPVIVDADWVRARLDNAAVALLDTRTDEEYTGTGERRGIPSDGHLAGARLLIWEDLLVAEGGPFKPRAELERIYRDLGADPGKTVVTYCFIGYRASLSYFIARYLGREAYFYDGSYADWSRRSYPLVKGSSPR